MKVMITGGLGFIGTNFVKLIYGVTDWEILIVDKVTYASDEYWLHADRRWGRRLSILEDDIRNAREWDFDVDAIIHFAAESHVDNAIDGPEPFIKSNVDGTFKLLEYAKSREVDRFLYISTDEVYGDVPYESKKLFKETTILNPQNPYSATKAAGEHLSLAYSHTHGMNVVMTRSCNNFGPHQHDEKLIPTVVRSVVQGRPVPVYGKGQNVREWIHVTDNCDGILEVFNHGSEGEVYNIGSGYRVKNFDLVMAITDHLSEKFGYENEIHFVTDRKGHDQRYALNSSKVVADLNWTQPQKERTENLLKDTVDWYEERYK